MKYNTPTAEELEFLESIKHVKNYGKDARNEMYAVYNRIFNTNIRPTTCGACLAKRHKHLMEVLKNEK